MAAETSSLPAHAQCLQHLLPMYPRMTFSPELLEATQRIDTIVRNILESFQQHHVQNLRDRVTELKQVVRLLDSPSATSHLPRSSGFLECLRSCYEPFCLITEFFRRNYCLLSKPPLPSEEKIKTAYAIATVMGAWEFTKFGTPEFRRSYEETFDERFKDIIGQGKLLSKRRFKVCFISRIFESMRQDPFWQKNPQLYETAKRFHNPRDYRSIDF